MDEKRSWWRSFISRLSYRYRFVVLNDETYEEKASFLLSRLNVILAVSTVIVLNMIFTSLVIIYTPLKQYIPGYGDYKLRKQIKQLMNETDQLTEKVQNSEKWASNVKLVLSGEIPADKQYKKPEEVKEREVESAKKKKRR